MTDAQNARWALEAISFAARELAGPLVRDHPADMIKAIGAHADEALAALSAAQAPTAAPGGSWTDIGAIADLIVRDVCELPDRTSPDDWPEAMLVTGEELYALIVERFRESTLNAAPPAQTSDVECHKLDTPTHVFFYEQDFYVLSNFSSFSLMWRGLRFDTSEAVYHWEKFARTSHDVSIAIRGATSAHAAFKIAQDHKHLRRPDWDDVKVNVMRNILRAKVAQHEYVRRKLLSTGDRILVEDSWRDDYWGWGPNRDGQNMLGKLWMEIRAELREQGAGQ